MFVCVAGGRALFRTYFDEKYDLIQKFRGVDSLGLIRENAPVDFMESGLMQRAKWDFWHIDKPFAINTDEATPVIVNDCYIGANHGEHSAVVLHAPNHGKTVRDVGSLWQDEKGVKFTLVRVNDAENLTVLSENVGETVEDYHFVTLIAGILKYLENGENTANIVPVRQSVVDLRRSVRYKYKKVIAIKDGIEYAVTGGFECDVAEIREEYDIINPATVASDLRRLRPRGGFVAEQDLARFGKPMLSCKLTYRIEKDGTVFTLFDYKRLTNVRFSKVMGVMYQEKLDVYGGGIWRYFPKALPFDCEQGAFDFSTPVAIGGAFPNERKMTREHWQDGSPNDRVVDYFRDENGNDKLAFACGYLPLYDGSKEIRDKLVSFPVLVYVTRKHYPTFADGDLTAVKGVGYKKYFIPQKNRASYYSMEFNEKTYLFVDIFDGNCVDVNLPVEPKLLEKSENIGFIYENGSLKVCGEKGFAVFVVE